MAGQPVNVIDESEIDSRVKTVVAQAVEGEAGVHLQRTSPTMAGIFVRGLTGNKVNVFVDGVRYSNGAQRGGVNTFLDLIEPESLEASKCCADRRARSTAATRSAAASSSSRGRPRCGRRGGPRWSGAFGGERRHRASQRRRHRAGRLHGADVRPVREHRRAQDRPAPHRRRHRLARGGDALLRRAVDTLLMDDAAARHRLRAGGRRGALELGAERRTRTSSRATCGTTQDGGNRYDQLLGGDGNLIAELNDLSLDLFSARLERLGAGWFDQASVTYSLNSQREERVNQGGNGNPTATISHEPERTTVHGIQAVFTKQVSPRAVADRRRRRVFRRPDLRRVQRQPGHRRESRSPSARAGRRHLHARRRVRADDATTSRPDRLRLIGSLRFGGAPLRARRPPTARSSTASRSGRTIR